MQTVILRLCVLFLLSVTLWVSEARASWYESTGSAPIIGGNLERARAIAVEDALRQSLDFAGGRVTSVEHVVDGVLKGSHFEWSSDGVIEQAHLVRERTRGERIEVTVRANIRQAENQCAAANFRKGVAVVPFELSQPEQARLGQVWDIEHAAALRFTELLGRHSQSLFLEHRLERKIGLAQLRGADSEQQMAGFARRIGKETDAQYVMAGIFEDISAEQRGTNFIFWTPAAQNRNLGLTMYLFASDSGELITRATVRDQAPWDFSYNEQVDTHGQRFWQSAYGNTIERAMQDMVYGLDEKLACAELRGQVVRVNGADVTVNLGSKHGVQAGQTLFIYHRGNFTDQQGIYREHWVLSPYQLEVVQVERSSALTRVRGDQPGGNIQPGDRVSPSA